MRYSIDIISIAYLLIITATKLVCFLFYSHKVIWVVVLSLLANIMAMVIKHNHCHLSMFRIRWMNYVMDMWLNLITGTSCSSVKIIHNMNHHSHINDKDYDWGSTHESEARGPFLGFVYYVLSTPIRFIRSKQKWLSQHKGSMIYKYNQLESIFISSSFIILCCVNVKATLVVCIIPSILLQFFLSALNYLQHYGHDPHDQKSNDFTASWFNLLFLNIGYHSQHHAQPNTHWSLLHRMQ